MSMDLKKWRIQKYFSTWQSRAWETGKPDMSYINENSFSRWIIEKSDGLTTLGLQTLSETVQDYTYLVLTSQTSTKGPIVGTKSRCSTNIPKYLRKYSKQESQYSRKHTKVSKDFTIC